MHNSVPADYLDPTSSETDKDIVQALKQAAYDLTFGGIDASDIVEEGETGGGSDSD